MRHRTAKYYAADAQIDGSVLIEAPKRYRRGPRDEGLKRTGLLTIDGIAAGLRNSG